jgi:hypothetical protein
MLPDTGVTAAVGVGAGTARRTPVAAYTALTPNSEETLRPLIAVTRYQVAPDDAPAQTVLHDLPRTVPLTVTGVPVARRVRTTELVEALARIATPLQRAVIALVVAAGAGLGDGEGLGLGEGEGLGVGVGDGEGVGDGLGVGVGEVEAAR